MHAIQILKKGVKPFFLCALLCVVAGCSTFSVVEPKKCTGQMRPVNQVKMYEKK